MKKSFLFITLSSLILQSCFVSNSTKLRGNKPKFGNMIASEKKIENPDLDNQEQIVKSEIIKQGTSELNYENSVITDLAATTNEFTLERKQEKVILDAGCDKITFLNGNEEDVKLMEIGDDYVKYKKCDYLDGPTFTVSKEKLFMIVYSNGNKEVIDHKDVEVKSKFQEQTKTNNNQYNYSAEPETNGLAVASLVFGILGFVPLLGLILGIIANNQITKNPNKYKGKGFAIAGIALSFFWIFILLLLLF